MSDEAVQSKAAGIANQNGLIFVLSFVSIANAVPGDAGAISEPLDILASIYLRLLT